MKILVKRDRFNPKQTIGQLFIDGKFECYTLEDATREVAGQRVLSWKIPHETAIPRGTYPMEITWSNRFARMLPLLSGVEGFDGVRLHAGNTEADTEGCILLGDIRFATYIGASRIAVSRVQPKIQAALLKGESVTITVE
jgi:hypothetical protein